MNRFEGKEKRAEEKFKQFETLTAQMGKTQSFKRVLSPSNVAGDTDPLPDSKESGARSHRDKAQHSDGGDVFNLSSFSMNGEATHMEEKMLEDKFVLGLLAIMGQSTIWYAPPNVGKTLIMLHLLIEAIKRGDIEAGDVFYINADDHHKGLIHKLKLAEQYGFNMLAPGYMGFKPEMFAAILKAMVLQDKASGKILILDTVKKFTDLMDKKKTAAFGESVRQFIMHGGTLVGNAHTNKHRNDSGGLIYAGTSDLVDDCDAAYMLDAVSNGETTGVKTVKFSNFKNRGSNALIAVYTYDSSEGVSYQQRLESVRCLSHQEISDAVRRKELDEKLERNREAIEAIKQCIRNGVTKKTELVAKAHDLSFVSTEKIKRALKEHEGKVVADHQFWQVNVEDNNCHIYQLNYGAY